jgi:exopolysaccharide biosynthesis polyprenyl glycosylphosphotransferase
LTSPGKEALLSAGDKPTILYSALAESEAFPGTSSYRLSRRAEPVPRARSEAPRAPRFGGRLWFALDAALIGAAAPLAIAAGGDPAALASYAAFAALAILAFFTRGAYRGRLGLRLIDELASVAALCALAAMAVISTEVLVGADRAAALGTARFALYAGLLVAAGRVGLLSAERRARRQGEVGDPTLIVGAGRMGRLAARRLLANPELGLRPIGFLDANPLETEAGRSPVPVLGASWDLDHVISEHGVRHLVIAFSTAPGEVLLRIVRRCGELGVAVSVMPRLFEVEAARTDVERLGALPLIAVRFADPKGWQFKLKYAVERLVAAVALLLAAPLFMVAAIAVRLTMGKPVLFRQARVGADGRVFDMLKLRTMRGTPDEDGEADFDWALAELAGGDGHGPESNGSRPSSDRTTVLGRFLRRFSLDEVPQLWNVLRGDMSLVGPRPERVGYVRRFERSVYRYPERHRVRSGITGWAQVSGLRGKTSLSDRVEWDNYYIENWSPWLDLKIILLTIACVVSGRHEERCE